MRARICDNCHVIIRGPYHKVIGIGSRPGKTMDLCHKCIASLYPMEAPRPPAMKKLEPKTRRLYDVPLDGSPIKVYESREADLLTPDQIDKVLNQGDYPPNSSHK